METTSCRVRNDGVESSTLSHIRQVYDESEFLPVTKDDLDDSSADNITMWLLSHDTILDDRTFIPCKQIGFRWRGKCYTGRLTMGGSVICNIVEVTDKVESESSQLASS